MIARVKTRWDESRRHEEKRTLKHWGWEGGAEDFKYANSGEQRWRKMPLEGFKTADLGLRREGRGYTFSGHFVSWSSVSAVQRGVAKLLRESL